MKLNVGVLRGGTSSEYEISLKSGGAVLSHLDRDLYKPVDLLVTRDGVVHADGIETEGGKLRGIVDIVFNALHGGSGEDGTAQKILDDLRIPQTGSGSEDVIDRIKTKDRLKNLGVKMPYGLVFELSLDEREDFEESVLKKAKEVFERISPSWIIKPKRGGSSADTFIARDFTELYLAMKDVFRKNTLVLVEEYIKGREIVGGLIENFRGKENYMLMPLEVKESPFGLISPRDISSEKKEHLTDVLKDVKRELGLKHYFTVNFILTPKDLYLVEIDALPHLHEGGVLTKSLAETGVGMPEFVNHCVKLALKN